MLERELRQSDVARVYVVRLPGQRWPRSAPAGSSMTSCTSIPSLSPPTSGGRGSRPRSMSFLLAEGAAHGARRTYLEVRRSNVPAQRLYESLGFTDTGVRKNYYSQPEEDALVLSLAMLSSEG